MTIVVLARALERILTVAAGTVAIYCGYRLFSLFPPTHTDSSGRLELPGMKIVFARVGPGLLFAALGIGVLAVSLRTPVSLSVPSAGAPTDSKVGSYSGSIADGADAVALTAQLSELRCLDALVKAPATKYPGSAETAHEALAAARAALVLANWRKDWGDAQAFRRWVVAPATEGVPQVVQSLYFTRAAEVCTP